MHTVQILLNTKACSQAMEKRFRAMTHIHNVCVKHGNKLLSRLEHDKAYQDAMEKRLETSKKLDGLQQKVPSTRKEERELEKQVTAMEKEIKSINQVVNYPPLMRGIPRLEVGASASWSFSFPAYEESSLQDDCNHPNLTISTGDPRRP